jgi:hypothetical protein
MWLNTLRGYIVSVVGGGFGNKIIEEYHSKRQVLAYNVNVDRSFASRQQGWLEPRNTSSSAERIAWYLILRR